MSLDTHAGAGRGAAPTAPVARSRSHRGGGHQLREDLLRAAIAHLAGLGSDQAFSLRSVARAAGVTPNAVYLHFADRDALLLAVLERLFANLAGERDAAEQASADAGGGTWARLLARSDAYVDWGLRERGAYRVLYEGRAVPRLAETRGATFGQPMLDRGVELVAELEREGLADPEGGAERAGLLMWTALHGIVSLRINKDTITWPDATELTAQAVTAIVRPRRLV